MAFSTDCPHKGCRKTMEPYIDPKDDKVFCSQCHQELTHLTVFTKNQLKFNKQFRQKSTTPFQVKCASCNREDRPILASNRKDILCPHCKQPHTHLSEPYKIMLREKLKEHD